MNSTQTRIQTLLDAAVAEGRERGAQVAVYHRGRLIVDAWAGVADARSGRAVNGDTLFPVFSVTKGIMSTVVHRLVERGLFGYDTPLAALWPEFAARGKAGITVRHALNHTAGLQNMPRGLGRRDLADWDAMCAAMARETPVSAPGAHQVYHAVTFSWLAGEVARRAAGRPVPDLIRDELCRPAGIEGVYCGLPASEEARVAFLEEPAAVPPPPSDEPASVPHWMQPLHAWMNEPAAWRACVPASNGIMSARGLARHYAALVPGGVDGIELLSPERVRLATVLARGADDPPEVGVRGLGYGPAGLGEPAGTSPTGFGHGGYGGATGFAIPGRGLAVAFTRNLYVKEQTTLPGILDAIRDATED